MSVEHRVSTAFFKFTYTSNSTSHPINEFMFTRLMKTFRESMFNYDLYVDIVLLKEYLNISETENRCESTLIPHTHICTSVSLAFCFSLPVCVCYVGFLSQPKTTQHVLDFFTPVVVNDDVAYGNVQTDIVPNDIGINRCVHRCFTWSVLSCPRLLT